MKNLWRSWPRLKRRFSAARRKILFLDFDGTLAPIAETPSAVSLPERTRRALFSLGRRGDYRVVVLSGRPLKELGKHLHFPGFFYVGNHGFEMRGRGLSLPPEARRARKLRFLMRNLAGKFRSDFYGLPGVLVEDKGCTVSLHFRNLARENSPAFGEALKFYKRLYKKYPVIWRKGKKVWEIHPRIRWDKGYAALYVLKKFPKALVIVLGDDRTDEDAFRALGPRGITIRVGRSKETSARYYLPSQKDVRIFLEALC